MYTEHFGLDQEPFSIAPDPRFLFLSQAHNEALAHLMYGFSHGGFVLITGEVGTGKTTLLRNLLDRTPPELDVAFVLNPRLTVRELLETLCDELGVPYNNADVHSVKQYIDLLNRHLLQTHQAGRSTVVIIDEAQNLSPAVLEQIRLLTNLETNERKLLRIILLGQPELADMLARNELRQLAQRITARYHLEPLQRQDIRAYVDHRIRKAGGHPQLFDDSAINALYRVSKGTPRLINIIADRALLGAYVEGVNQVSGTLVRRAANEVLDKNAHRTPWYRTTSAIAATVIALIVLAAYLWVSYSTGSSETASSEQTQQIVPAGRQASEAQTGNAMRPSQVPTSTSNPADSATASNSIETASSEGANEPANVRRPDLPTVTAQRMAYRAVFQLWGNDYPVDSSDIPCNFAPKAGLQCLGRRGGWNELNQINAPVVLELWDDEALPYHGALLERQGELYKLQIADTVQIVSPRDLRDHWYGAYVVLWQTPPNYLGSLRQGEEHSTVAWLHNRLREILPDSNTTGPADNLFDEQLHNLVLQFQAEHFSRAIQDYNPLPFV